MAELASNHPPILNSWKEIASYLGRGVRTVQRWEHELRLPVRRIGKGKRSPVYALIPELKFWITTTGINSPDGPDAPGKMVAVRRDATRKPENPLEVSHRLTAESIRLVRTLAENSIRQQRQAEDLQRRILLMRARLR